MSKTDISVEHIFIQAKGWPHPVWEIYRTDGSSRHTLTGQIFLGQIFFVNKKLAFEQSQDGPFLTCSDMFEICSFMDKLPPYNKLNKQQ